MNTQKDLSRFAGLAGITKQASAADTSLYPQGIEEIPQMTNTVEDLSHLQAAG